MSAPARPMGDEQTGLGNSMPALITAHAVRPASSGAASRARVQNTRQSKREMEKAFQASIDAAEKHEAILLSEALALSEVENTPVTYECDSYHSVLDSRDTRPPSAPRTSAFNSTEGSLGGAPTAEEVEEANLNRALEISRIDEEERTARLVEEDEARLALGIHISRSEMERTVNNFWVLLNRPTLCNPLLDFFDQRCQVFAAATRIPTAEQLTVFEEYGEMFDALLAVEESAGDVGDGVHPTFRMVAQSCAFIIASGDGLLSAEQVSKFRIVLAVENFGAFRHIMEEMNREVAGEATAKSLRQCLAGVAFIRGLRRGINTAHQSAQSEQLPPVKFGLPVYESQKAFEHITMASICTEEEEVVLRKHRGKGLLASAIREQQDQLSSTVIPQGIVL